ncbi:Elongator subunit [Saccharomycopsis crataegensis]|uniref:Elongator complex protein 2 n=1 Tax=Saccharomycopsis crataegensis TaxID=43959 RepID=A0AAV5QRY7_9ASCO|nr:Elongator subunit [Saccharomycopsis crataegensis]
MVNTEAIFAGANPHSGVSDFNSYKKQIAFGAGHNVAIWNPLAENSSINPKGIEYTLKGHTDDILNVKYCSKEAEILVTSSADKTIKVWKSLNGGKYKLIQSIDEAHDGSIYCLSVTTKNEKTVMVSGCSSGKITIWELVDTEEATKFVQAHQFTISPSFYSLSLSIYELTKGKYILLIGGTKPQLYVYTFELLADQKLGSFSQSAVLSGHENWIKSIVINETGDNEYLIASGSLDRYIRLWKLSTGVTVTKEPEENSKKLSLLSNKKYNFSIGEGFQCSINFEALILGHDDWISCLNWYPKTKDEKLRLLSTSADTSTMIWEPDAISGVWVSTSRLGELSIKGASTATGASGGFWSSIWYVDEESNKEYIFTHGRTGSWRVWSKDCDAITEWKSELGITGPAKEVTDVQWSANQDFLLSTSLDQTTRLYAQWMLNADGTVRDEHDQSWREFARPQIHGYDMICIGVLNDNLRFVSGGDEKVMRSFSEPKSIMKLLKKFCGVNSNLDESSLPEAASLPTLGLSNKAEAADANAKGEEGEGEEGEEEDEDKNISYEVMSNLVEPPLEDHLQRHTLWPEIEKLYGHGYELTTLDVSHDGKYIVSCCKSNNVRHAILRLFDTKNWLEIRDKDRPALEFHELTVNRVRFSKDDKFILSVSRDRKVGIWKKVDEGARYELWKPMEKAHTRIIWDGDWAPTPAVGQKPLFVTGSRDKSIKIWEIDEQGNTVTSVHQVKFSEPVTAVSVYGSYFIKDHILIAAGLEGGALAIYMFNTVTRQGSIIEVVSSEDTPSGRINRLSWRLEKEGDKAGKYYLAVASADRSTRIYSIDRQKVVG